MGFLTKWRIKHREKRYCRLFQSSYYSIYGIEKLKDHDKKTVVVLVLISKLSKLLSHKLVKNVKVTQSQLKLAFNPKSKSIDKCVRMEIACDYSCCYYLNFVISNCSGRWVVNYTKFEKDRVVATKSLSFQDFYELESIS